MEYFLRVPEDEFKRWRRVQPQVLRLPGPVSVDPVGDIERGWTKLSSLLPARKTGLMEAAASDVPPFPGDAVVSVMTQS